MISFQRAFRGVQVEILQLGSGSCHVKYNPNPGLRVIIVENSMKNRSAQLKTV